MKKLGMICLTLVIAIGCIGVVYARWGQSLVATPVVNTGNWTDGQFQTAIASSGSCTVDSYPTSTTWPTGTIIIKGTGPTDNNTAFNSTISYTIINNGSVPIKVNNVMVSILSSTTMESLRVYDLNAEDPLANFDYTNSVSGGAAGGTTFSSYINPIFVGAGNTVSGTIVLYAPAGSGVNGKNCIVMATFTSKASTQ